MPARSSSQNMMTLRIGQQDILRYGTVFGFSITFVLSTFYVLSITFADGYYTQTTFEYIMLFITIFLIGAPPYLVIGIITERSMGFIQNKFSNRTTIVLILVNLMICSIIAIIINICGYLFINSTLSQLDSTKPPTPDQLAYEFSLIFFIPSIIYVITGTGIGIVLHLRFK